MLILNICVFASTSENEVLIFYFKKIILKIKKNCLALSIFLSFFIKILCQSKEFPLSTQSTLQSNPSLSRKNIPSPPSLPNQRKPIPRGRNTFQKRRSLNNGYVRQHLFLNTACINLIFLHNYKKQTQMFNQNHSLALHSIQQKASSQNPEY